MTDKSEQKPVAASTGQAKDGDDGPKEAGLAISADAPAQNRGGDDGPKEAGLAIESD